MKCLLIATVLVCTSLPSLLGVVAPQGINEKIAKFLEKMKKEMPCGFPEQGIPPLAPFKQDYAEWTYKNILFSILASIVDFRADGLNDFVTNDVTFSALTLKSTFDISFIKLITEGQYVNNFVLMKMIKLVGKGDVGAVLEDLRVKGKLQLAAKDKGLYIKDFEVIVVLANLRLNITGILGGGIFQKFTNRILEKVLMFFIKYQAKLVSEAVYDIAVPLVNEHLKNVTARDLLDLINSVDDPVKCIPPVTRFLL